MSIYTFLKYIWLGIILCSIIMGILINIEISLYFKFWIDNFVQETNGIPTFCVGNYFYCM